MPCAVDHNPARVGAQAQLLINVVMYGVGFAAALKVLPELDEEY